MQVKRYEVATMNDAMTKIKNDLGPEAIILSAKKIRNGRQDVFEVMAARDEHTNLEVKGYYKKEEEGNSKPVEREGDIAALLRSELREIRQSIESLQNQNSLSRELAEIKETMNSFFDVLGMRKGRILQDLNSKLYLHLLGSGFSRASACRLVDTVNRKNQNPILTSEEEALLLLEKNIGCLLPSCGDNHREKRIKMFIGPTGVGKTTTLAKLAARYSILKKKSVGLISTDNFRIAATEQLGTYAKIMGLRMEKASTPETFAKGLEIFADKDVILVDTPGRAHPDSGYLHHLRQAIPDQMIETNILINATGGEDYFEDVISGHSRIQIDRMIVTKIDESRRLGRLYDAITRMKKPVSYLTCGQNVPQDIEEITPDRLANLMVRGTSRFLENRSTVFTSSGKES